MRFTGNMNAGMDSSVASDRVSTIVDEKLKEFTDEMIEVVDATFKK